MFARLRDLCLWNAAYKQAEMGRFGYAAELLLRATSDASATPRWKLKVIHFSGLAQDHQTVLNLCSEFYAANGRSADPDVIYMTTFAQWYARVAATSLSPDEPLPEFARPNFSIDISRVDPSILRRFPMPVDKLATAIGQGC